MEKKDDNGKDKKPAQETQNLETSKEIVKPPKPEKPKELPPINLTKNQLKIYRMKMVEHESMRAQQNSIFDQVTNENKRALVEDFAEELGINLMERKYEFDRQTLTFRDFNVLKEQAQQQQMQQIRFPSGKRS